MSKMPELVTRTKVGLVFDDGFAKSSIVTAELFEKYGLRALFAVLANPADFAPKVVKGDFDLWNELAARGHRVQPHGYTHARMPELSFEEGLAEIEKCLEVFSEKLAGFDAGKCVYHFTYNLDTAELTRWLLPRVAAVRNAGDGFLSDAQIASRVWGAISYGPDDPYEFLRSQLQLCRERRPAAYIFNLHGIDGEAWGATSLDHLQRIIELILGDDALEYWGMP
jgi:peptidoglycan/xylan/chitin deacetylase (PgdA/CDA1 family)